jgi:hypothetical protein
MKPSALVFAVLMCSAHAAHAALIAPIVVQGNGPYYQLTLPASIYSHAAYADLRDLRITNGAGQSVPFAWLQAPPAAQRTTAHEVPLFQWPVASTGTSTSDALLAFTVRPDGSLALARRDTAGTAPITDYLLDASQLKGQLLQARITVARGTQGLFPFVLEASDDLRRWQRIGGDDQLVVLQQGGQTIERLTVDLRGVQARFLRLHWQDPKHTAQLTAVGIDTLHSSDPVAPIAWLGPLAAEKCGADYCDYRLPRGIAVHGLRVQLAQSNTLVAIHVAGLLDAPPVGSPAPVQVHNPLYALRRMHRQTARASYPQEVPLLDTVVYRLAQPGGEARSPDLALNGAVYPRLRIRTNGPVAALGSPAPTLEVSTALRSVVFLAQGQAPYSLAWGAANASTPMPGKPLALATLIPGYSPHQPVQADPATVSLAAFDPVQPVMAARGSAGSGDGVTGDTRKPWLWAALLVGLLVLAGMAWSLFQSMQKRPEPPAAPE